MQINCMYCHTYARRSNVSGIPRLDKCMGCHNLIEGVKDRPRIKKLFEYWENKQPIPWKKVHDLPDFVRFNHERHIQRFYFQEKRPIREACGYCHGDIASMTTARRVKALSMGWCVSCHQKDHLEKAGSTVTSHGPNDCWLCHK
ncbi:cytochrome c3 family protein [Ferrovum sp.]